MCVWVCGELTAVAFEVGRGQIEYILVYVYEYMLMQAATDIWVGDG